MAAALFTINIAVSINEVDPASGALTPVSMPLALTGNHIEKINLDVPANTTVDISVPLPVNSGVHFVGLAATGATLTITSDDDDEGESHDTVTVTKGQPILYYPAGTTPAPFAHTVKRLHVHNADLVKPAVLHLRILRDCTVLGAED